MEPYNTLDTWGQALTSLETGFSWQPQIRTSQSHRELRVLMANHLSSTISQQPLRNQRKLRSPFFRKAYETSDFVFHQLTKLWSPFIYEDLKVCPTYYWRCNNNNNNNSSVIYMYIYVYIYWYIIWKHKYFHILMQENYGKNGCYCTITVFLIMYLYADY